MLQCPNQSCTINPVMNKNTIINDYLEALTERAEMAGDGRLEYAMGFLQGSLKALELQTYELEVLQRDTLNLRKIIAEK